MHFPNVNPLTAAVLDEVTPLSFFPAEMPVSYDTNGAVASRFGDLVWDLSSMSTDATTSKKLHFFKAEFSANPSLGQFVREQQKALIWLHIDAGKTMSWSSLEAANLALVHCCREATDREADLYTLLTDLEELMTVAREMNRAYLAATSAALKTLWRNRERLGAPTDFQLQKLRTNLYKEAKSRPEYQQTSLIPSRVYCDILATLDDRISACEQEIDALLDAYAEEIETSTANPRTELNHQQRHLIRTTAFSDVIEHMRDLGTESEVPSQFKHFIFGRLTEHKITLMLVVAAYTGMRVGEVEILPLDNVLVEFEHMGSIHYEVHGWTHKLNRGVKLSTTWITSHQGARAIKLAQRIARSIEQRYCSSANPGQKALLFSSNENAFRTISSSTFQAAFNKIRAEISPVVTQFDVEELDRLELARGWLRNDIVVGKRWPFAFHQLRRSLAVYAHRSGIVSLPALKAQLQHITQEMAAYYADGFSRAVNLVYDKEHFSHEWQAAKSESSYFAYALGVLFSDKDLLGQGAQRMADTVESRNRQDTLRLFRENKLAYRETPLGGCVSTDDCEIDPLEPIPYDCLESNCVNLVVFGKRLEHIIKSQEVSVATLVRDDAGSVEHRLEARHLEVLLKARQRLKKVSP